MSNLTDNIGQFNTALKTIKKMCKEKGYHITDEKWLHQRIAFFQRQKNLSLNTIVENIVNMIKNLNANGIFKNSNQPLIRPTYAPTTNYKLTKCAGYSFSNERMCSFNASFSPMARKHKLNNDSYQVPKKAAFHGTENESSIIFDLTNDNGVSESNRNSPSNFCSKKNFEKTDNSKNNDQDIQKKTLSDFAESKRVLANILYKSKQYDKAVEVISQAINASPKEPALYFYRAVYYKKLQMHNNSLNDAKKCLELDPKNIEAYIHVIKCSILFGDIQEADSTLNKLKIEYLYEKIENLIKKELNELKQLKQYLNASSAAYLRNGYDTVIYYMKLCNEISIYCVKFKASEAECLVYLRKYQEAEAIINDILQNNCKEPDAIFVRGLLSYYQGDFDTMFEQFNKVLEMEPNHLKAANALNRARELKRLKEEGNYAFKEKRYNDALNLYTKALEIDSKNEAVNSKLHFNKATVLAKLGNLRQSISECNAAIDLDENYLKPILRRAACYMELEYFEEAIGDYETALEMEESEEIEKLLSQAKMALAKPKKSDYYEILGIERDASPEEIKKAYKRKALEHHPDRHVNDTNNKKQYHERKFKEVGQAYDTLTDPVKRYDYNCSC